MTDSLPAYPQLLSHILVHPLPPDSTGREGLAFVTHRRHLVVRGRSVHKFYALVLPLLDGRHTPAEIAAICHGHYSAEELSRSLHVLSDSRLLQPEALPPVAVSPADRLAPQLSYFHEMGLSSAAAQETLNTATVTILGLGDAGAVVATALAAAHIGTLHLLDPLPVAPSDLSLVPAFTQRDIGEPRVRVMRRYILARALDICVTTSTQSLGLERTLRKPVSASTLVVCCLSPNFQSVHHHLNRLTLDLNVPWTSCTVSPYISTIGPTIIPRRTPCYLCYKMRSIACAADPQSQLLYESFIDEHSGSITIIPENVVSAVGTVANLLAVEVFKFLIGPSEPTSLGKLLTVDFLSLSITPHVILRKPWCPACFTPPPPQALVATPPVSEHVT